MVTWLQISYSFILSDHRNTMKRQSTRSTGYLPASALKSSVTTMSCLAAAILFLFITSVTSPVSAQEGCGELLKSRCAACHYLTRVCQKIEKNQKKGFFGGVLSGSWGRTIKNMIKQGAKLNEAEQEKLTQCLDNSVPEILDLCGLKK